MKNLQILVILLKNPKDKILEASQRIPLKIRWYCEALLQYQAIPIHVRQPIFLYHHYEWQSKHYRDHPELIKNSESIIEEVIQSYWDEFLRPAFAKKPWYSMAWKNTKARLRTYHLS